MLLCRLSEDKTLAVYSLANRTSNVTLAAANLEIRTAATDRPRVMEIGVWMAAATASVVGIGRPQAIGGTPTTPVTVLAEDPGDPAGTVTTALAWGTPPTVPLQFFRRLNLPATIGAGVILTFPRGLVIAASNSIVHWNITATGIQDAHCVIDE
jgi:hypothetical protein